MQLKMNRVNRPYGVREHTHAFRIDVIMSINCASDLIGTRVLISCFPSLDICNWPPGQVKNKKKKKTIQIYISFDGAAHV